MTTTTARPGGRALLVLAVTAACGETRDGTSLRVAPVTTRDIVVSASAAGVIEPVTTVEVKSKASGEIVDVLVDEGDPVRAGQLLVRVDPRIPLNAVVQAEADSSVARAELDNAEAQLERATRLHQTQAITDLEFESARLARATAYAALVRARRALEDAKIAYEDTEVRAPSAGVILGRAIEVGSVIASASRDVGGGAVLLRMASLDTVLVRGLVDETDIGMIVPGTPVTITVAAYPNRPFGGRVQRIGAEAVVQQNVTMFPVLIRIANAERLLRPGMNAEVEIHIGALRGTLAVPTAALRMRRDAPASAPALGLDPDVVRRQLALTGGSTADSGGGHASAGGRTAPASVEGGRTDASLFGGEYVVFRVRGGAPEAVPVRAGLTDFDYTAVLAGLQEGDSVALLPTAGLLEEQQQREQRARERAGGALPPRTP
jgi:HlyD family secretion protein